MELKTETLVPLCALCGRILESGHPVMQAINRGLSPMEREVLSQIVMGERRLRWMEEGCKVTISDCVVSTLSLMHKRICHKQQTEVFIPSELKALAECTGIQCTSNSNQQEPGESENSHRAQEKLSQPGDPGYGWVW